MSALTASLQHRRDDSSGTNSSKTTQSQHTHHNTISRPNSNTTEYDTAQLQQNVDTLYDGLIQQMDAEKSTESKSKYKTTGFIILSFKHTILKSYGTLSDTESNTVKQTIQMLTSMITNTDKWITYNSSNDNIDDNVERITIKIADYTYNIGRAVGLILVTQLSKK